MHLWFKRLLTSYFLSYVGAAETEVYEQRTSTCQSSSDRETCRSNAHDLSGFLQFNVVHSSPYSSMTPDSQVNDHVTSKVNRTVRPNSVPGGAVHDATGEVRFISDERTAHMAIDTAGHAVSKDGHCLRFLPLNQRMWLGMFQALPVRPKDTACITHGLPLAPPMPASPRPQVLLQSDGVAPPPVRVVDDSVLPFCFLAAYIVISVALITAALRGTFCPDRSQRTSPDDDAQRRPEADAWVQGYWKWLSVSWADRWVMSWGSLRHSDRRRWEHLGRIADPLDESAASYDRFDRLWQEEVAERGLADASLVKVISRFVTLPKAAMILICIALEGCLRYFCPILAVQWLLGYLALLYEFRAAGQQLPPAALLSPSVYAVIFFMGLPIVTAALGNAGALLSAQVSARLRGALASAVFAKSLRLPSIKHDLTSMASPRECNLIQLIGSDIDVNIANALPCLAKISVLVPVVVGLLLMLSKVVDWAVLIAGVIITLAVLPITWVGVRQLHNSSLLQWQTEQRLHKLQEMLLHMWQVKMCGCDEAVQSWLSDARKMELQTLSSHYQQQGFFRGLATQLPKAIIVCTLGGAIWLHGQTSVSTVLLCLQMLAVLQSVTETIAHTLPNFLNAVPSCQRVGSFLRLEEILLGDALPSPPSTAASSADLSSPRPTDLAGVDEEPGQSVIHEQQQVLHIQGSFAWDRAHESIALRKLDFAAAAGEMVAVIGRSGSGKTALLNAILGELHPMVAEGCQCMTQGKVGFVAQDPRLAEGSIRELVKYLRSQQHIPERYQESIWASGLYPDIKDLPVKDQTLVTSQGCTFSAGQRVRISLARAGYVSDAIVVLLDDPFSAVDAVTAKHISEQLLHGPLMQGRTLVVVCQPDFVNALRCDRVVIMSEGQILVQGKKEEVMKSSEYHSLLSQNGNNFQKMKEQKSVPILARRRSEQHGLPDLVERRVADHEQELDADTDWSIIDHFFKMGPWANLMACIVLFLLQTAANMMIYVVMSRWSTLEGVILDGDGGQVQTFVTLSKSQLLDLCVWWLLNIGAYFLGWMFGADFALRIARRSHEAMMNTLMCASIDHLHHKSSVGRVMNRVANDVRALDLPLFSQVTESLVLICWLLAAVFYVNLVMPVYFSLVIAPFYILLISLTTRYWNTTMPIRHLSRSCWSAVGVHLVDAEASSITMRSYQMADNALIQLQQLMDRQIYTELATNVVLGRWVVARTSMVCGFFASCVALVAIWIPGFVDLGTTALCVTCAALVVAQIESYVEAAADIQTQVVAMGRLHEFETLPQQGPAELDTDARYCSFSVSCERPDAHRDVEDSGLTRSWRRRSLEYKRSSVLHIVDELARQSGLGGTQEVRTVLRRVLADIVLQCPTLRNVQAWHEVTAVNDVSGSAALMTEELCHGTSPQVQLHVKSNWLTAGAKLEVQGLRAGYANARADVLQDVDLHVDCHCKLGLIGGVNSGKSTLLLCLQRLLEPRAGRILLEGVDIAKLGLKLLRKCISIVPSKPVLFADSLRSYLDPSSEVADERLQDVLTAVGLDSSHKNLLTMPPHCLSHGQQQLLCLARAALQAPSVLLIDDAGAALDPRGRDLLPSVLLQEFADVTAIIATRHLDLILNLDVVAVMDRGMIIEKGPVQELSQLQGGQFANMLAHSLAESSVD